MPVGIPGTKRHRNGNPKYRSQPRYRVLLTNGRFPVTIDLARQLYYAGHYVYCVDPMEYHVCKFSIAVKKSRQVPAPHVDGKGYIDGVRKVVEEWKIDLIIPLHEEIFFLASCEEEGILKRLIAPPFRELIRLHNKWEFTKMMKRLGLDVPEAHLCRNMEDVRNLDLSREWAVKPVFGRASSKVHHLKPGKPVPDNIDVDESNHYIAQEWSKGKRYCSYSVIRRGKLQAHGLYPVLDTIDGSSSVYFKHTDHPRIKEYVKKLAAQLPEASGQLAFDFVEEDHRLVTMECNPRSTSGIHLFSDTPFLARALTDTLADEDVNQEGFTEPHRTILGREPRAQVAPGMLMWDHSKAGLKEFWKHLKHLMGTKDVLWKTTDMMPSLMQPFLLTAYYQICRERKLELADMFQWDLTWEPDEETLKRVRKMIDAADKEDDRDRKESQSADDGRHATPPDNQHNYSNTCPVHRPSQADSGADCPECVSFAKSHYANGGALPPSSIAMA